MRRGADSPESLMEHLGDRRLRVRFEVVGALSGVIERVDAAEIVNISPQGALVLSTLAPPIDSTLLIRLAIADADVSVNARVRHFRVVGRDRRPQYMVGLEFISTPSSLTAAIEHLTGREFEDGIR